MLVVVNGEDRTLPSSCNLAEALLAWGYQNDMPIAVAVNNKVIPKQEHSNLTLNVGNKIEILMPMQGG